MSAAAKRVQAVVTRRSFSRGLEAGTLWLWLYLLLSVTASVVDGMSCGQNEAAPTIIRPHLVGSMIWLVVSSEEEPGGAYLRNVYNVMICDASDGGIEMGQYEDDLLGEAAEIHRTTPEGSAYIPERIHCRVRLGEEELRSVVPIAGGFQDNELNYCSKKDEGGEYYDITIPRYGYGIYQLGTRCRAP